MRRFLSFGAALALGAAFAVFVSSCGDGGDKLLSSGTADQLLETLDAIEGMADEGQCDDAADSAGQVASQLNTLTNIDPELKAALIDGFERIQALAADPSTCSSVDTTTQEETTEETPTRTREATTTEEVPTQEAPPTTQQTTPTQPTTPTSPPTGGTGGGPGL